MNTMLIAEANLELFIVAIIAATKKGWEMNPKHPPALYGFYYEVEMLRDASITDEPKMTAAESLAKARAAKKAKGEQADDTDEA